MGRDRVLGDIVSPVSGLRAMSLKHPFVKTRPPETRCSTRQFHKSLKELGECLFLIDEEPNVLSSHNPCDAEST